MTVAVTCPQCKSVFRDRNYRTRRYCSESCLYASRGRPLKPLTGDQQAQIQDALPRLRRWSKTLARQWPGIPADDFYSEMSAAYCVAVSREYRSPRMYAKRAATELVDRVVYRKHTLAGSLKYTEFVKNEPERAPSRTTSLASRDVILWDKITKRLSPAAQQVFRWHYVEGHDFADIDRRLGLAYKSTFFIHRTELRKLKDRFGLNTTRRGENQRKAREAEAKIMALTGAR